MVYRPAASHYLTAMGVDDLVEVALAVDDAEAEEDRKDLPSVDRDAAETAAQKASQPSRAAGRTLPTVVFAPGLTIGRALPSYSRSAAFALPRPDAPSSPPLRYLQRRIIPNDMRIPSPAAWPIRAGLWVSVDAYSAACRRYV
jgi:hypothetical protein